MIGAALPLVIFFIAIGGALAVGGSFVTRQLAVGTRIAATAARAEPLAERGIVMALAGWDSTRSAIPVGATVQLPSVQDANGEAHTWVTRLDNQTFLLVSQGSIAGKPLLDRRLGLLIQAPNHRPVIVGERPWMELP